MTLFITGCGKKADKAKITLTKTQIKYEENAKDILNEYINIRLELMSIGDSSIYKNKNEVTKKINNLYARLEKLVKINNENSLLKEIKIRGESCNSDHCPFYEKGVPSFFIYTLGGKGNYHNIYDTYNNLDLRYSPKVKQLLIQFINQL